MLEDFSYGAGFSAIALRNFLTILVIAAMFLWLAWQAWGGYTQLKEEQLSVFQMASLLLTSIGLVTFLLAIL